MPASLALTLQPGNLPPRVALNAAGFSTAAGAAVTITRRDSNGITPIRTANPAQLASGSAPAIYDYEAPYTQPLSYTASDGTTSVTATSVSLASAGLTQPWLLHPGVPALSVPLAGVDIDEDTFAASQGVHVVMNRQFPIVRSDVVRQAPTFNLSLRTNTDSARDALEQLLSDSSPLLLQVVQSGTVQAIYRWVSVGDVVRTRLTRSLAQPVQMWQLPCVTTDAPAGLLQAQRTYTDLLSDFDSYADLDAAFTTYAALLAG